MDEYLFNVIKICQDDNIRFFSEVAESKESIDDNLRLLLHDRTTHRDYYCIKEQYDNPENQIKIKAFMHMLNIN